MAKKIITIGREFGSGGQSVGKLVAARLGLPYYDKELLLLAHTRSDVRLSTIRDYDEKRGNRYMFYEVNHEGNSTVKKGQSMEDTVYDIQRETILNIAEQDQGAVIIGRCADQILKAAGYDCLSVFIGAPLASKAARIAVRDDITVEHAKKKVKETDKSRRMFYESRCDELWGHPGSYDLCLNTDAYPNLSDVAEVIIARYQEG